MGRFRANPLSIHLKAAVLACASILPAGCAKRIPIPQFDYSRYRTVAVLPFQTEGFLERYGAEIADEIIIQWMAKDPAVQIVERSALSEMLEEQKLRANGGSAGTALQAADLVLTGSTWFTIENVTYPNSERRAYFTATVRAFEPASGRIVWSARERGDATVSGVASSTSTDWAVSDSALREQAVFTLAANIVRHLGATAP